MARRPMAIADRQTSPPTCALTWEAIEDTPCGSGQCWLDLLGACVLVDGYPISRRSLPNTGLEASLEVLATLTDAKRIDTYNQRLYIKGFSTMLVPVETSGNLILWHLFFNPTGARISYFNSTADHLTLKNTDIEQRRHILGWCTEAEVMAGKFSFNR